MAALDRQEKLCNLVQHLAEKSLLMFTKASEPTNPNYCSFIFIHSYIFVYWRHLSKQCSWLFTN